MLQLSAIVISLSYKVDRSAAWSHSAKESWDLLQNKFLSVGFSQRYAINV